MSYIMLFIHLTLLLILVLMWGFTHGSKPDFYFRIYFQLVCFCSFARYVTDPATWTSSYLWDPSLPKQTFIAHAWISVWGERAWNGDFTVVVMAASTCAPLRRFGLIFLKVLLTEEKDTDSDFFGSLCVANRFGPWMIRDSEPWKQFHQQAGVISSSWQRDSPHQLQNFQLQNSTAEAFCYRCFYTILHNITLNRRVFRNF